MNKNEMNSILNRVFIPILDRKLNDSDRKFRYEAPKKIIENFNFILNSSDIETEEKLKRILYEIIDFTPNVWKPEYANYLYASPDPIGILADWVLSLLNTNVHSYEASPALSVIEVETVSFLNTLVGYKETGTGIFCPGGSFSNMYAIYLAKKHFYNDEKHEGVCTADLVLFTSEASHYSIEKSALFLGFSEKSIRKIKADRNGKMIPADLKSKIEDAKNEGFFPFFVNATSGTTVLGGFDPIDEIIDIIDTDVWLHVDAAWGGAVLFSERHKKRVSGIEQAHSITFDLHKSIRAPLLCSALLLKKKKYLGNPFEVDDSYLFHSEPDDSEYDLGKSTPWCGRRGDALKFWLTWKIKGEQYYERKIEKSLIQTSIAIEILNNHPSFRLYSSEPEYLNVCFWYLPQELRGLTDLSELTKSEKDKLDQLTKRIYKCLKREGDVMVNFAQCGSMPSFFRLIVRPELGRKNIDKIIETIDSLGFMLTNSLPNLLISGGDSRQNLGEDGSNYILISPEPQSGKRIYRSSCTGTQISEKNYESLKDILRNIKGYKKPFSDYMASVHNRIRKILRINDHDTIITVPSGTEAEYIPLMVAKAQTNFNYNIVNIVTGVGEIGSNSTIAAEGKYFTSLSPKGKAVDFGNKIPGIGENVEVISLPFERAEKLFYEDGILLKKLNTPDTLTLLHIVDSSKLGRRMNFIDEIQKLREKYSTNLLIVIDSCQSRTDATMTRYYLKLGYMVMITGSKFEEGPPFSGAIIIPSMLTGHLNNDSFNSLLSGLKDYITKYDVSGGLTEIENYLPSWQNWGLMMRWHCALNNWESFRKIDESARVNLIQNWIDHFINISKKFQEFDLFCGGESQEEAVGERNTILSFKLIKNDKPLKIKELRNIYNWLNKKMSLCLPRDLKEKAKPGELESLDCLFLIGQPVDLKDFAVLRVAIGAGLVCHLHDCGTENEYINDKKLLSKLSFLVRCYDEIVAQVDQNDAKTE